MKTALVSLAVAVILAAGVVIWFGIPKGPGLDQVAHLKKPQIANMPAQKVLQVTVQGDPANEAKKAFGKLMKTYFKLKGVPKSGPDFKAPRASWKFGTDTPREKWIGRYAMPVPATVSGVPSVGTTDGLKIELTTWEYGEVAQILHVGPYAKETPTISELRSFIRQNGYEIMGEHEEEYLKGPGMIFTGDPEDYLTLIRYPVRMKMAVEEPELLAN